MTTALHGTIRDYSSLDTRDVGRHGDGGKSSGGSGGSGESKDGHAYASVAGGDDEHHHHHLHERQPSEGVADVVCLTSPRHVAIPLSYFCIGFLARWLPFHLRQIC